MDSPKGNLRLFWVLILGLCFVVLSLVIDLENLKWVTVLLPKLSAVVILNYLFYWLMRWVIHLRSHELLEVKDGDTKAVASSRYHDRQNYLIVAHAIITCGAMLA